MGGDVVDMAYRCSDEAGRHGGENGGEAPRIRARRYLYSRFLDSALDALYP